MTTIESNILLFFVFQEISPANYREREIKAPTKIWTMQKKPINSIISYKDWIYTGSTIVEGSNIKVRCVAKSYANIMTLIGFLLNSKLLYIFLTISLIQFKALGLEHCLTKNSL